MLQLFTTSFLRFERQLQFFPHRTTPEIRPHCATPIQLQYRIRQTQLKLPRRLVLRQRNELVHICLYDGHRLEII